METATPATVAKRNDMLDFMRGLLILVVVFGHSIQIVHGGVGNPVHNVILFFQMPAFFVLAGVSYTYIHKKAFWPLVRKHCERLGVPYLTWLLLGSVCTLDGLGHRILHSNFWFLREMLFAYLIFDAYAFLVSRCHKSVASLVVVGLGALVHFGFGQVDFLGFLAYFAIGYGISNGDAYVVMDKKSVLSRFLLWSGRQSLGIYAFHWSVLFYFSERLLNYPSLATRMPELVAALIVFVIWTILSVVAVKALTLTRFTRYLFLGQR